MVNVPADKTIYCSEAQAMKPEEFKHVGGCCNSCHEDEAAGYDSLLMYEADEPGNPYDRSVYVCCAVARVLGLAS
jgi:hypothetical protein